jgi:hypothetical protein
VEPDNHGSQYDEIDDRNGYIIEQIGEIEKNAICFLLTYNNMCPQTKSRTGVRDFWDSLCSEEAFLKVCFLRCLTCCVALFFRTTKNNSIDLIVSAFFSQNLA